MLPFSLYIMVQCCTNIYIHLPCNVSYLFIAMASNVNLSLSEDNSSGTDLSDILTENKERIDTTNWTLAK